MARSPETTDTNNIVALFKRVYLAGPEVFLANARDIGARKRAICERHGLVGVFPADEEDAGDPAPPLRERGLAISRAMERAMRGCDAMIVNLTPFRGPSADVGSAYEMGFGCGWRTLPGWHWRGAPMSPMTRDGQRYRLMRAGSAREMTLFDNEVAAIVAPCRQGWIRAELPVSAPR